MSPPPRPRNPGSAPGRSDRRPKLAALAETPAGTERMLQEIARLRAMLDTNSDWIWEVDAQGRYTYASRHSLVILGYEPSEILGRTPFDFMPPDESVRVAAAFADILREKRAFAGLINHNIHRDGRIVVLETSGVPLVDAGGDLVGYRGIDRDVTSQEAERTRLHRLARRDDLTGLGNRLALREQLLAALADSAGPDFGVILLDLDDFKPINDSLGHGAGDLLLTLLATRFARLAAAARAQAFRLGGDEFVLVTGDGAGSDLPSVAGAVRSGLTEPFELCGTAVTVTASLGMTRCAPGTAIPVNASTPDGPSPPEDPSTPEDILARADAALYAAKAGRPTSRARQGGAAGETPSRTRFIASGA